MHTKARKKNMLQSLLDKTFLETIIEFCLGTFLFYFPSAAFIPAFMLLLEL